MSWNYRVMKRKTKDTNEEIVEFLEIHEVYYDSEGSIEWYTKNGVSVGGSDLGELRADLAHMLEALKKPILDYEEDREKS